MMVSWQTQVLLHRYDWQDQPGSFQQASRLPRDSCKMASQINSLREDACKP
jgi:hypothetical protein